MTDRYDVFLSYSRRDAPQATQLQQALGEVPLDVWRDDRIDEAQVIPPALEDAVRSSTLTLALLTDQHQASNACRWELLSALAHARIGGRVPPVLAVVRAGRGVPAAYPPGLFEANAVVWDGRPETLDHVGQVVADRVRAIRDEGGARPPLHRAGVQGAPGSSGSRFVGRFPDLLLMFDRLLSGFAAVNATAVHHSPRLLLRGEPGMGKTSIAAFFAERFSGRFEHGVLWLDAVGDRVDAAVRSDDDRDLVLRSLSRGVERWLHERDVPVADLELDAEERWVQVRARLRQHLSASEGRLLLVVDDVPRGVTLDRLDVMSEAASLLFTSRHRDLADQGVEALHVDRFQRFESMLLLTGARDADGSLRRRGEDPWGGRSADAEALADAVGDHPMAVDLLGLRLRDIATDPVALLKEIRTAAPRFLDVQDVTLPLQHRGNILATVSGSVRSAARESSLAPAALRLLAVAPAGRAVPVAAVEHAMAPWAPSAAPVLTALTDAGLLRMPDGAGTCVQHQIVHAVTRELWRRAEVPFTVAERPHEPDLSRRFAEWHHREGEQMRNVDDGRAAEVHGVVLHVLDEAEAEAPASRQQALQRAYGLLAQARLTYRAGDERGDYEEALEVVARAAHALDAFRGEPDVEFAFHTAEALRGLVLSRMSTRLEEARAALDVILAADAARSEIAGEVLRLPPESSPIDHDYVRDVLARSRYNIPGRVISITKALHQEQPTPDWAEEARRLLDEGEEAHREVITMRTELWDDDQRRRPASVLSLAASEHGIGMMRYYAALLPGEREERVALLRSALRPLATGLRMRDEGRNEGDVGKSLGLLIKTLAGLDVLRTGALDAVLGEHSARCDAADAAVERLDVTRYTVGAVPATPLSRHRDELRNALHQSIEALEQDGAVPRSELHRVLELATKWLTLARAAGLTPIDPRGCADLAAEVTRLVAD